MAKQPAAPGTGQRALGWVAPMLVATPLLMNPWGLEQYQLPRLVVQTVLVIVGLALAVSSGVRLARPLVPLAALLVVASISALVSRAPRVAFLGTDSRRFGVVGWLLLAGGFVVGMACESLAMRRRLLATLSVVSVPVSLYAVLQRLGWDPFDWSSGPLLRPVSTVGNASFLGALLAVCIVVSVGLALERHRPWWLAVAALDIVALMLTGARGAWIGVVVGLLLLAGRARHVVGPRPVVRVAGVFALVIVVMVVAVPGVALRAASITGVTEGTAGGRVALADIGLRAAWQQPLLGWGPDISRPAMEQHLTADFEDRYGDRRIEDRVHDTPLDLFVWMGILGVAVAGWFVLSWLRVARRSVADTTVWVLLAAIAAFAVHLLFNFPVPELDVVVWLLMGTVVASTRRLPPAPLGATLPVAGLALLLLAPAAVDAVQADRDLRVGVDLENRGDPIGALSRYLDAAEAADSALYHEVVSRASLRNGRPADAVEFARLLVRDDPSDPYARELLAASLTAQTEASGDVRFATEAEQILRDLVAAAPHDGSLQIELARAVRARS